MVSGLSPKIGAQKHGFLQFSQKLDYGLFLLIELARMQQWVRLGQQEGTQIEPLALRNFAEANGMSFLFMQKAAFELRRAGIITAVRGKNGGYCLSSNAGEISLKDVVEALEGPVNMMHCLIAERESDCSRQSRCKMRHGLGTVNNAIVNIFAQTTLLSLLNPTWQQET